MTIRIEGVTFDAAHPLSVKNRMHFDLGSDGPLEDELARLGALGATEVARHRESGYAWVVMQDPEGNEFCVGEPSPEA